MERRRGQIEGNRWELHEQNWRNSSERTECTTPLTRKRFEDRVMEIVPIKTERDYRRTLKEIEA